MALLEHRRRHEVRQQRLLRRAVEGARRAEDGEDDERSAQRERMPIAVKTSSATAQSAFDRDADRHDGAAAKAVGDRAGDEHEQQRRKELREADEAEVERIAGQVVDLPADRDRLDLHGEARGEPRQPVFHEGARAGTRPSGRAARVSDVVVISGAEAGKEKREPGSPRREEPSFRRERPARQCAGQLARFAWRFSATIM